MPGIRAALAALPATLRAARKAKREEEAEAKLAAAESAMDRVDGGDTREGGADAVFLWEVGRVSGCR
jgi:hypothetical protein